MIRTSTRPHVSTASLLVASLAAAFLALTLGCGQGAPPAATITPDALAQRIEAGDPPLILDVRSEAEFAAGHIPGAINIPHDQVAERLGELPSDPGTEIVVHCQSGKRAALAEDVLGKAGYENVRDLEGHWAGWSAAQRPKS